MDDSAAALIAFEAVNLPAPTSLAPNNGQPYRLSLSHALPPRWMTRTYSFQKPYPCPVACRGRLKEHADLPHKLTERMGNWKAAEAEPDTVCLPFWIKKIQYMGRPHRYVKACCTAPSSNHPKEQCKSEAAAVLFTGIAESSTASRARVRRSRRCVDPP